MAATLADARVGQIHISVTDIDRSVAFYRDTLGLPFLFQVPGRPMAFFDCGGTRLYLAVRSIDDAHAALVEAGVEFLDEPHVVPRDDAHELGLAFFTDPDGCRLALMEERAR